MTKSILICDDEPHVTQLLALNLEEAGFRVRDAPNGLRALELACEERPDLLITDFQMPLMNGLELARRLREEDATADVPILMLTSRSHRVDDAELARTSIVRLLPKPFSPREVTQEVLRLLSTTFEAGHLPPSRKAA